MEVSFEQLKSMVVFSQVVDQGSLTAAAKAMGISRGVVSYHLKKLEEQLGVKLLNRTTRSLSLTETGEAYYQRCRTIAYQAHEANLQIEKAKQEPVGKLKITCPVNLGLQVIVPALNEFRRLYPLIELNVSLSDDVVNIIKEGVDLAIRGAPLLDSGLQASKLTSFETCLCGSPEYFRRRGRPTQPEELYEHDWVVYTPAANTVHLSQGTRSYSLSVHGAVSTNNAAARTIFLEGGNGIGRIPMYDALPRINQGRLERILPDYQCTGIDVYAVFPPGTAGSKKLRLLLDFLKVSFTRL
ncbi:LysR family transcriptional regulator [Marinomonas primoryensis]|jgi:DNA-binding transcriptional LysR family regulator|uniref:LysR family transcriptional regulator n=1 Tax=Marinomonas primoryensis TaxID=178399 RepID=A0A859CZY1_9GAMM|nr:LysR family transcriptional regulator [Marinomonas primoryensis]QKK82084.1 LysR family transcriptional regulator [Marinomonas primoryensis]|tara:strand:+ start:23226 stop:24119 length:894 start_codon:yes stop_codon:yes gene_type:complete